MLRITTVFVLVLTLAAGMFIAAQASAAPELGVIKTNGPLKEIRISNSLKCDVKLANDDAAPFRWGYCGTFVHIDGVLYAPWESGGFGASHEFFEPVSQTAVSGKGTETEPYKVKTVVKISSKNLTITQIDRYVVGDHFYRTEIVITGGPGYAADVKVYRALNCSLGDGKGLDYVQNEYAVCADAPGKRFIKLAHKEISNNSYNSEYGRDWWNVIMDMSDGQDFIYFPPGEGVADPSKMPPREPYEVSLGVNWGFERKNSDKAVSIKSELMFGSDSTDTDGDGLPDIWEIRGKPKRGHAPSLPINEWGADLNKRDIFLQINWMEESYWEGHDLFGSLKRTVVFNPNKKMFEQLVDLFAKHDILLHIDAGDYTPDRAGSKEISDKGGGPILYYENLTDKPGGADMDKSGGTHHKALSWFLRSSMKANRYDVFRFGLIGNRINKDSGSSGVASFSSFFVSAGTLLGSTGDEQKIRNTILHELGHTLDLWHGGPANTKDQHALCKINYRSVMNYLYQFILFDYENQDKPNNPKPSESEFKTCRLDSYPYKITGGYEVKSDWANLKIAGKSGSGIPSGNFGAPVSMPPHMDPHPDEILGPPPHKIRMLEPSVLFANQPRQAFQFEITNNTDKAQDLVLVVSSPGKTEHRVQIPAKSKKIVTQAFNSKVADPNFPIELSLQDTSKKELAKIGYTLPVLGLNKTEIDFLLSKWGTDQKNIPEDQRVSVKKSLETAKTLAPDLTKITARLSGSDAIATNLKTIEKGFTTANTVYIANDVAFQDALAAGSAAAKEGGPLLLVHPNQVPTESMAKLKALKPTKIVLQGGRFALSPAVEKQIKANVPGARMVRNAGSSAQGTAIATSKQAFASAQTVYIANDFAFSDALAAGPVAGQKGAPILLVTPKSISSEVVAEINRLKPKQIVIVGGKFAVAPGIADVIKAKAKITPTRISGKSEIDTSLAIANTAPNKKQVYLTNNVSFTDALGAGPVAAKADGIVLLTNGKCLAAPVSDRISTLIPGLGQINVVGGKRAMSQALMNPMRCM